jgi:hypothetical protein
MGELATAGHNLSSTEPEHATKTLDGARKAREPVRHPFHIASAVLFVDNLGDLLVPVCHVELCTAFGIPKTDLSAALNCR